MQDRNRASLDEVNEILQRFSSNIVLSLISNAIKDCKLPAMVNSMISFIKIPAKPESEDVLQGMFGKVAACELVPSHIAIQKFLTQDDGCRCARLASWLQAVGSLLQKAFPAFKAILISPDEAGTAAFDLFLEQNKILFKHLWSADCDQFPPLLSLRDEMLNILMRLLTTKCKSFIEWYGTVVNMKEDMAAGVAAAQAAPTKSLALLATYTKTEQVQVCLVCF